MQREDPELYNDSDEEEDDDDWDLAAYRKRTEDEREELERKRIIALGGTVPDKEDQENTAQEDTEPPGGES